MTCYCHSKPTLCLECVERIAFGPEMKRKLRAVAQRWGRSVYARQRNGTWPQWDQDTTGRLQRHARQLVTAWHMDEQVLDRLARQVASFAGDAYRECQRLERLRKQG